MRKTALLILALVAGGTAPAVAATGTCSITHAVQTMVMQDYDVPCYDSVFAGAPVMSLNCGNCPGTVLRNDSQPVCIEHTWQPVTTTYAAAGHFVNGVCVPFDAGPGNVKAAAPAVKSIAHAPIVRAPLAHAPIAPPLTLRAPVMPIARPPMPVIPHPSSGHPG